jgi:glycine/D-amino acid oxidase-like deaminating enzyme
MRALVGGGVIGTAVAAIALGVILVRRHEASSRVVSQIAPPARQQEALEELTKQELYERARKANVADRSKMSKDGLIKALRATS